LTRGCAQGSGGRHARAAPARAIDLARQKSDVRRRAKAARAQAFAAKPEAGDALARHFLARPPRPLSCVAAGYWPIRDEIDPRPLLEALRRAGAAVCLPVVGEPGRPLTFRLFRRGAALAAGPHGVRGPGEDAPEVTPQIVFVPLLAFDRRGGRLGWGGGHYDRTLAALRAAGDVAAVGLAFSDQEVDAAPTGPLDQPLDWILTERGLIKTHA